MTDPHPGASKDGHPRVFWGRRHPGFYLTVLAVLALGTVAVVGAAGEDSIAWALALAAGAASFMVGGLIGFVFGIPRYAAVPGEEQISGVTPRYRANTNLEQISDWLTKILVGIGLTQAVAIARAMGDASEALARAFSDASPPADSDEVMALALLLVSSVCGFLFFYLWSRLYMPKLFGDAEAED